VENVAIGCTIVLNRVARELLIRCTPSHPVMHDAWAYPVIAAQCLVLPGVTAMILGIPSVFPSFFPQRPWTDAPLRSLS
jgi:hypothetical protein